MPAQTMLDCWVASECEMNFWPKSGRQRRVRELAAKKGFADIFAVKMAQIKALERVVFCP
jgi:hypothetical protein